MFCWAHLVFYPATAVRAILGFWGLRFGAYKGLGPRALVLLVLGLAFKRKWSPHIGGVLGWWDDFRYHSRG